MARKRFIVPWTGSDEKPAIYHCVSRVVDRRYALEQKDKEQFRSFMRMYEKFTGCRVLTYCLMCNHIHLLVEVTPRPAGPMTDEELLRRYRAIYSPMAVSIKCGVPTPVMGPPQWGPPMPPALRICLSAKPAFICGGEDAVATAASRVPHFSHEVPYGKQPRARTMFSSSSPASSAHLALEPRRFCRVQENLETTESISSSSE